VIPVVYAARYRIDIGLHVFPTLKFELVSNRLLEMGVVQPFDFVEPEPASWDELALVHTSGYLTSLREGTLTLDEQALLELPASPEIVEGFRLMAGGTIQAALIACDLQVGSLKSEVRRSTSEVDQTSDFAPQTSPVRIAAHIGGGLHHAFPSHGEGFCMFNDVAVAARVLLARGVERIAIVDLDVHHGNGTAFIFESDPRVFTFSMHQQHNYPMFKPRGSLDIGLPDGARDATYLHELERALPTVMAHRPQCVFYLAGADPYEDDQLGGLRLTKEGLRRRDRLVIAAVRQAGVPLVITLAGGYARHVEDTVAIHAATVEEAIWSDRAELQ
jgi:acetoin utilization deacetylase AcuC-like enzyme